MNDRERFERGLDEHPVRSRIGWGIGFVVSLAFWMFVLALALYILGVWS